jgi:hypothetical protein
MHLLPVIANALRLVTASVALPQLDETEPHTEIAEARFGA